MRNILPMLVKKEKNNLAFSISFFFEEEAIDSRDHLNKAVEEENRRASIVPVETDEEDVSFSGTLEEIDESLSLPEPSNSLSEFCCDCCWLSCVSCSVLRIFFATLSFSEYDTRTIRTETMLKLNDMRSSLR